jgi:hypothetical protein
VTEDDRSRPLLVAREWHATGSAAAGRHSADVTAIEPVAVALESGHHLGRGGRVGRLSMAATTPRRRSFGPGKGTNRRPRAMGRRSCVRPRARHECPQREPDITRGIWRQGLQVHPGCPLAGQARGLRELTPPRPGSWKLPCQRPERHRRGQHAVRQAATSSRRPLVGSGVGTSSRHMPVP